MVFKVEFYKVENEKYPILKTALIYAESVSDGIRKAKEMQKTLKQKDVYFQIEEEV